MSTHNKTNETDNAEIKTVNKASSAKTRKFKMGGFSLITSVLVVAAAIAINFGLSKFPVTKLQYDITRGQLFDVSDQTREVIAKLDKEVTIYWIVSEGKEDTNLQHFLDRYDELSDFIKVERRDPSQYPTFVNSITDTINSNSLYVECGDYHRYIDAEDLYTEEYYNGYGSEKNYLFNGDNCITSAVDYVTNGKETVIYMIGGHGEGMMSSDYVTAIENLNIEIRDLSIILDGSIPEDADAIFICAPAGDISKEEEAVIFDYLRKGGRMMLVTYPTDGDEHANIEQLMAYYGLNAVHGYVMEGDSRYMAGDAPAYVLPSYTDHQIVSSLANKGYYVMLFGPQGLLYNENQRDTLSVTPLLISSDKSYAKPSGNVNTYEKEEGDVGGPFILAAAIDETVDGVNTRIVWITSDAIIDDNFNNMVSGGNQDMLLNSLTYLCKGDDSVMSIHPKSLEYQYMIFSGNQGNYMKILLIGIIPLAYMLIGVVIYMKRKKR